LNDKGSITTTKNPICQTGNSDIKDATCWKSRWRKEEKCEKKREKGRRPWSADRRQIIADGRVEREPSIGINIYPLDTHWDLVCVDIKYPTVHDLMDTFCPNNPER